LRQANITFPLSKKPDLSQVKNTATFPPSGGEIVVVAGNFNSKDRERERERGGRERGREIER
jgi:hypothetical protein